MGDGNDEFRVEVSVGDEAIDVRVVGEIDIATVDGLRATLWDQPDEPRVLRLDLSEVDVLVAAGARMLAAVHARRRERGGQLVLCNPNTTVRRVLRAMRVNRVVTIVGTAGTESPPRPARRTWTNSGPVPRRSSPVPPDQSTPSRGCSVNQGPMGLAPRSSLTTEGWPAG